MVEHVYSRSPTLSALGVTLTWLSANVAYYMIYTGKLLLSLGGPQLLVRLDEGWTTYWTDVSRLRLHEMVGPDFLLWSTVAVLGGLPVGWLGGTILLRLSTYWWTLRGDRAHLKSDRRRHV